MNTEKYMDTRVPLSVWPAFAVRLLDRLIAHRRDTHRALVAVRDLCRETVAGATVSRERWQQAHSIADAAYDAASAATDVACAHAAYVARTITRVATVDNDVTRAAYVAYAAEGAVRAAVDRTAEMQRQEADRIELLAALAAAKPARSAKSSMSYKYEDHRSWVFTDEGQRALLKTRDRALHLCAIAGAFSLYKAVEGTGDTAHGAALVDRLVELGDIREITQVDPTLQQRLFVRRH